MQAWILTLALLAAGFGTAADLFEVLADRVVMYDGVNPPPRP